MKTASSHNQKQYLKQSLETWYPDKQYEGWISEKPQN